MYLPAFSGGLLGDCACFAVLAELADAHGSGPCEETHGGSNPLDRTKSIGMWLSLVERLVRDEEAAGSNPVIPTNGPKNRAIFYA